MVKSWKTSVNASVSITKTLGHSERGVEWEETQELFEGSDYFFDMLYFHWQRRKDAGKPLSVGGVCSYFSEVDKGNDGSSIEKFKTKYKGGRILDIKKTASGQWEIWVHIPRKGMLCEK